MRLNNTAAFACSIVWALAGLTACNILDGSDGKKATAPLSAEGADAADQGPCSGLPGPAMVEISSPDGVRYCIDTTEVTQAQYAEFLAKATSNPGTEHADCAANTTYAPRANPIDPYEPKPCPKTYWTPDSTPNRPAVCMDWCDAYAYCAWAGKRLCGSIAGGRLDVSTATIDANPTIDASHSQWFNACSQGGSSVYPYGNRYDPAACEGYDSMKDPESLAGYFPLTDVGTRPACTGSGEPYSRVGDMSGAVEEFVDECGPDSSSGPAAGLTRCGVRGGHFGSSADQLTCGSSRGVFLTAAEEVIGFRCCKDLPK